MIKDEYTDMDNEKQLGAETPPTDAPSKAETTATPTLEGTPPVVRAVEPPPDGGLKAWMTIAGTFVSGPCSSSPLSGMETLTPVHRILPVRTEQRLRRVPGVLRDEPVVPPHAGRYCVDRIDPAVPPVLRCEWASVSAMSGGRIDGG